MILGIADISEAAWRKRVRQCGEWLDWLLREVVAPVRSAIGSQPLPGRPRVILVDGTRLGQTGGTGDEWRVQLAYDLVAGRLVHVQIGDCHQAETPETLQLAGWILLLSTLEAEHWPAEKLFWLYRNRWQIELLIKQMKQFLSRVRLRSSHPETVRATLLAALVAWALQEEEGQALLRTLMTMPEPGQQSLVQAYLPLLEQWEVEEFAEEAGDESRRPISCWLLLASCTSRWRAVVLGQWSFAQVQTCLSRLRRFFCLSPRRRMHQWLWFQVWAQHRFLGNPGREASLETLLKFAPMGMLPLHPTSPKGMPIHPRLRKSGDEWAVLCKGRLFTF